MNNSLILSQNSITSKIYQITRGEKSFYVILDRDLAQYYQTTTEKLNQASKRNPDRFIDSAFKLTKEEYLIILKQRSQNPDLQEVEDFTFKGGHLPTVYTEAGALSLSGVLKSVAATKVSQILLNSFFAFREIISNRPDLLIHQEIFDLKNRVLQLEKASGSSIVIHNLHNHSSMQIGTQNSMSVQINSYTDIIRLLTELQDHQDIKNNPHYVKEIKEAIALANKEDSKSLLDKFEKITSIVNNIADLATKASPVILPIIYWLKSL